MKIDNIIKKLDMKKILIVILSIVLLIGLSFLIYRTFLKKITTYTEVDYNQTLEKINSNERFALFIGSATCPHCTMYKVTVNDVIKDYNINIYYIDISKLTNEQYAYLNSHFPFKGTPVTIIIEDGKEYERQTCRIEGAKSYDYVVERLKKAGIIKE